VLRADADGVPIVAVGGDRPADVQITGLFDALHFWLVRRGGRGPLRYVVGSRKDEAETRGVLDALAGLTDALADEVDLLVELDFEPVDLVAPDFAGVKPEWLQLLRAREDKLRDLPPLARRLATLVDDPSFRWSFTVRATTLSGRIDGLEVCTLSSDGRTGRLKIGAPGRNEQRLARERFRAASDGRDEVEFSEESVLEAAEVLLRLIEDRRSGPLAAVDPEHRLEGRILRGVVGVNVDDVGRLEPVLDIGQIPTLWRADGRARYLDVLMRQGSEPWAVELKVTNAGRGKYLRHAIAQAVLYRRFIGTAQELRPWFAEREPPLTPTSCRAAIAFPALTGTGADSRRDELRRLAALFDVAVVELDVDVDDLPAGIPEPLDLGERDAENGVPGYRVLVRFATQPDDPVAIADDIRPLLPTHDLAVVEDDDIELTLDIPADGVFAAARTALDRVQSALGESRFVAPELLAVEVEGIFAWAEEESDGATEG
jgi:hypothetical protein